jgi:hypothetical protein
MQYLTVGFRKLFAIPPKPYGHIGLDTDGRIFIALFLFFLHDYYFLRQTFSVFSGLTEPFTVKMIFVL